MPANDQGGTVQQTTIEKPQIWSLESPQLYQLRTTISQDGQPVDSTTTHLRHPHDPLRRR